MRDKVLGVIGATGLVGREVTGVAKRHGWRVIGFSRRPGMAPGEWREWSERPDVRGLRAVVNLAGYPVDRPWTEENRRLFHESRVGVTLELARALRELDEGERPEAVVNASAVGYYGHRRDEVLEESSEAGSGYLADLCREWEAAADELPGRVSKCRIGMVLAREGPAFQKMVRFFRWGLGGRLGSGRQWMPWVHVNDLAESILHVVEHPTLAGPFNAVVPSSERNADFTRILAAQLKRPAWLPVPGLVLKKVVGEFASAVLASQRVRPKVLQESGFGFRYPTLPEALKSLL